MLSEWTMTKLLNTAEVITTGKEYSYNKTDLINSKPALQTGNENLIEYPIALKLHISFCNPEKVIEMIEKYAQSRDVFEWVFYGKYMGEFFINSFQKKIITHFKGTIIYAEVNINLIENPDTKEFEEQKNNEVDLSDFEQHSENSSKLKDFAKKVKDSAIKNLKQTIIEGNISDNLSDAAKEVFSSVSNSVIQETIDKNISDIYSVTSNILENLNGTSTLNVSELEEICDLIKKMPDNIIKTAVGGVL